MARSWLFVDPATGMLLVATGSYPDSRVRVGSELSDGELLMIDLFIYFYALAFFGTLDGRAAARLWR